MGSSSAPGECGGFLWVAVRAVRRVAFPHLEALPAGRPCRVGSLGLCARRGTVVKYTPEGIDAEIVRLNGRAFTFAEIVAELGVSRRHIARVLRDAGTMPYHERIVHRPGKGERPRRSRRVYPGLIGDKERELRATKAIVAAHTRLTALFDEQAQLLEVRAHAVGELTVCGLTQREIAALIGVTYETIRSDQRRAKRLGYLPGG